MRDSHQHLSCADVVELVTGYLERSLPAEDATLFEQHLNFCDGCVWYVDQIRTTVETVGRIEPEEVPLDVRDRLLTAFRDWKSAHDRLQVPAGRRHRRLHGVPLAAAAGGARRMVQSGVDPCRSGIHACRRADLPLWAGRTL